MKKYVTLPLTNSLLKTKQTLYNLPSVSRPPLAENNHDHVLPLNSRSKTIQSQPPSNKIPSTQLFPHVSPAAYLMTEQLSIPQHSETVQHLSTVLNQDAVSQLNVTTQDASSATLTTQLTLSGQTGVESFQANSGTQWCFDQNALMQTLSSDIFIVCLKWAFMPSMQPKLHTRLLGDSSHISLVTGVTPYLNAAVLTTFAPSPSVTYPVPL